MQHCSCPNLCIGVGSFDTILWQNCYFQMLYHDLVNIQLSQNSCFCHHSNSHLAVGEHKRMHRINVFIFAQGGGKSISCIPPRGLQRLPNKHWTHLNTVLSFRASFPWASCNVRRMLSPFLPNSTSNLILIFLIHLLFNLNFDKTKVSCTKSMHTKFCIVLQQFGSYQRSTGCF